MPISLHHIIIDAHDLPALARFWAEALRWRILSERERHPVVERPPDGRETLAVAARMDPVGEQDVDASGVARDAAEGDGVLVVHLARHHVITPVAVLRRHGVCTGLAARCERQAGQPQGFGDELGDEYATAVPGRVVRGSARRPSRSARRVGVLR
ncbi:hypothetical protein GCM10010449_78460 [Streptomyces rectiviolaceus]|uniref:Glyoxalase-like domain-containing protein n=1 Tax=Streptomyces rectiviolaceus TaxID=332591 RepID=A0ABP6NGW8_9ACTN